MAFAAYCRNPRAPACIGCSIDRTILSSIKGPSSRKLFDTTVLRSDGLSSLTIPAMESTTKVFIRDDDFGKPFEWRNQFHSMFVDRQVPIAYQVVPFFLDRSTAAEARAMREAHPRLVEFHQHGTRHEQTLRGEPVWSEFAGDEPYESQLATVLEGRGRLVDLLGEHVDLRVFTPPAHKYGPATLRALEDVGVTTLSCGVHVNLTARVAYGLGRMGKRVRIGNRTISHHAKRLPHSQIREWSCAIDVDQDGHGNRLTRSASELMKRFSLARRRIEVVGLMFHHECYTDNQKFDVIESFLDELCDDETIQFVSLGSLPGGTSTDRDCGNGVGSYGTTGERR